MSRSVRIVLPVRNRVFCIDDAIGSVLSQSFSDFELIVVDDGSTDRTADRVAEHGAEDPRVRLLRLPHQGAAGARNAAIALPGAPLHIAFLDSDDLWACSHLERAMQALTAHPRAFVYFCATDEETVPSGFALKSPCHEPRSTPAQIALADATLSPHLFLLRAETCRQAFLFNRFVPMTPTLVLRYDAVLRTPWFAPEMVVMEDSDLHLALAGAGRDYLFDARIGVRVRRFGDTDPFQSHAAKTAWLASVLAYDRHKLALCRTDHERDQISAEVASSLAQVRRHSLTIVAGQR